MSDSKTKSNKSTTAKKMKIIGKQEYLNISTGNVEDFQVIKMEDRDFNFHKIWLAQIITSLDLIGNQKTRLAFWILDHLNRDNQLTLNYRQIAEESGISLFTVKQTMKALLECDFLRRKNQGCYVVNPDKVFKGTKDGRMRILLEYSKIENQQNAVKSTFEEKRASNLPVEALQNLLTTNTSLEGQKTSP